MKIFGTTCLAIFATCASLAQQQPAPERAGARATAVGAFSSLPIEGIGIDDLVGISVYAAPELSGAVRVDSNGDIRLPMVKKPIHAAGLFPEALENAIAAALTEGNVLVDPIVTVNVVEYRSRPIAVVGAVRTPTTFQADSPITLLDAISRAGGIVTESAGTEILVTHSPSVVGNESMTLTERIPLQSLMNPNSPAASSKLLGGDIVRVPTAGQVYVMGDVNKPGPIYITDGAESSVFKALALTGGPTPFSSHTAYIYRVESGRTDRTAIPVKLKKIMNRKSPDVPLMANDILYVPDAAGRRLSAQVLETTLGLGLSATGLVLTETR